MRWAPLDTWPDVRVTFHLLPWTWRLRPRAYADDVHPWGFATVEWLFLKIEWWAQDRPSLWFREPSQYAASAPESGSDAG